MTQLLHAVQEHPVTRRALHADFLIVRMTEEMTVDVSVAMVGESVAIEKMGGTLLHLRDTIQVRALPGDLPSALELDAVGLHATGAWLLSRPGDLEVGQATALPVVVRESQVDEVLGRQDAQQRVQHGEASDPGVEDADGRRAHQGWLRTRLESSGQKQAAWRTDPKQSGAAGCFGGAPRLLCRFFGGSQ